MCGDPFTPKYNDISEIPDSKSAIHMVKSKYIKEESSKNVRYDKDIYLTFSKAPYDENGSNEKYYTELVEILAYVNKYRNLRLIDEKNGIEVGILCDNSSRTIQHLLINGDPAFFARAQSYEELNKFTKTPITDFNIQSIEINHLIDENWDFDALDLFDGTPLDEEYEWYPEDCLQIRCVQDKVFNLRFELDYSGYIINKLTATSTFEDVVRVLGKPTFGSVDGKYIGYKGEEIYIFFNGEYVSVYPVEKVSKIKFNNLVNEYIEEKDEKNFVSKLTDLWDDYDNYTYSANTIDLSYVLKGVKIQYNMTEYHGITIYNNYVGAVTNGMSYEQLSKEENCEIPVYIYFRNEDSIDEYERERTMDLINILYNTEEEF